ncbi:MAG: PQQ-binding-like beta-propeller repeat protein, partial [Planctomycetaceae bacterium]
MTTSLTFDDNDPAAPPRRRIHWKTGAVLLLIGVLFEAAAWWYFAGDRSTQVMWSYGILSGTALAMLIWWTLLSGLRWWIRLVGLAVLAVGAGVFLSLFTFVRNDGAMVPVFQLRSSVAERLKEKQAFFKQQQALMAPSAAEGGPVELEITEGDWPQFRGPQRDGIVRHSEILLDWPASWSDTPPKPVWRHPVGLGWSSFAIVDGRAFTQEQRGENECVVCYDAATGEQIWLHEDEARFTEAMGGEGPRATPTVHDSKVYALGATGILNCLDAATGKRLWTRNILDDAGAAENLNWAMAGSPLIYRLPFRADEDFGETTSEEVVVVNPGGGLGRGVIGYDPLTGRVQFSGGDHIASYCAPKLATLDGVPQLLIFDAEGLTGHDPRTAEPLWHFPWENGPKVNAAQAGLAAPGRAGVVEFR